MTLNDDNQLCPLYAQFVYLSDESDIENDQKQHLVDSPVTVYISADESDNYDSDDDSSTAEVDNNTSETNGTKIKSIGNYNSYKYIGPEDDIKGCDKSSSTSIEYNNQQKTHKCRVKPIEMDYLAREPLPNYLETIIEEDEKNYISSSSTISSDDDQVTSPPLPATSFTIKGAKCKSIRDTNTLSE